MTSHLKTSVDNQVATIVLDRPEALNALNLAMIEEMSRRLAEWEADDSIKLILVRSAHPKAFCAGGDIRRMRQAAKEGDYAFSDAFFLAEYRLIHQISRLQTPYVSVIDGICMGGGLGIAIHGKYRIASEKASFAMPEVAIGLVPDVGASHFLSRLPDRTGLYIGMTGLGLSAREAHAAGMLTHVLSQIELEGLARLDMNDPAAFLHVLADTAGPKPHLKQVWDRERYEGVARAFAPEDPAGILEALQGIDQPWAHEAVAFLEKACPFSLQMTVALYQQGHGLRLTECIAMELNAARASVCREDFIEGVRAVAVDKDRNARWKPATLAEASEEWRSLERRILIDELPSALAEIDATEVALTRRV
jgi:enoyl-CoA hydratase